MAETAATGSRKVSTSHLKRAIYANEMFDFIKEKVENVPDVAETEKSAPSTSRRRAAAAEGGGRANKRARTSRKTKKEEEEDDDLISAEEDEDEQAQGLGRTEDDDEDYQPGYGGSVPIGNMMGASNSIEQEPPALLPNFSGAGIISHSPNYIPPGGPVSASSGSEQISDIKPNFGNNLSSSILNPVSEPAPAPHNPALPASSSAFTSTSTSSWGSRPGGLPPPRFAPGGSEKIKPED